MGLLDMLKRGGAGGMGKVGMAPGPPMPMAPQAPAAPTAPPMGMLSGGPAGMPDWSRGLLARRQASPMGTSAGTGGSGLDRITSMLSGDKSDFDPMGFVGALFSHMFKTDDNPLTQGLAQFGGAPPQPGVTGPGRPMGTQFDPAAYLQSRGVYPNQIKMPF